MHKFQHQTAGWTLIETMIVAAIVGVLSMMAVPMVTRYGIVEDARAQANMISSAISEARSQAMAQGNPTFLLFNDLPGFPGAANAFALLVNDLDSNGQINGADTTRNFLPTPGMSIAVTGYGLGPSAPYPNAPLAAEDQGTNLNPAVPLLQNLNGGASTFPFDPVTNVPAIGFNSQGIPVSLATPTQWGTGAGAYYITDNHRSVYAVVVLPLGGIRVRVLSLDGTWH